MQVSAIGRHSGQGGTLAICRGIIHQLLGSKLTGGRVEALLIDVVFQVLIPVSYLRTLRVHRVLILKVGTAEVESLAIGSPAGEHLKLRGVVLQVGHLVLVNVVGNDVAGLVIHLNLVGVGDVEILEGLVGGIHNQVQRGMPGRIHTCREDGVVLHVDFLQLAVHGQHGSTIRLAGMKLHPLRVVGLIVVAVDALSVFL